jgi:hypothetical protein
MCSYEVKLLGLSHRFNIPGHTESSSLVERFYQSLNTIINSFRINTYFAPCPSQNRQCGLCGCNNYLTGCVRTSVTFLAIICVHLFIHYHIDRARIKGIRRRLKRARILLTKIIHICMFSSHNYRNIIPAVPNAYPSS